MQATNRNEILAEKLALLGGSKTIEHSFARYNSIGLEEEQAVKKVIESGVLSQFLGAWHEDFYGGPYVLAFEKACREYFGVKYVITVNSWTSGLIAAVGAIGIEPGDEIITTPWTMCASATAILHWNAIPIFADIEEETFCLDPRSVEANITARTKAILAVDIFGHSADMSTLREIARKYNLKLISDTAQAPGAKYKGQYAGTLADVGGYSLNYHKHIHTGEGGILVTNDDEIAERLQLIRNHAEAVVGAKGDANLSNMIGYNFRLGEMESAIGIEQLKKLNSFVLSRQRIAQKLHEGLKTLPGLRLPIIKKECTHVFYTFPLIIDVKSLGVTREAIYQALKAEGVPGLGLGYQNVHLLPMYQKKIAYGSKGFPWTANFARPDINYQKGICPVAENLHQTTFLNFAMCMHDFTDNDLNMIISAFKKVWMNLDSLKEDKE